MKTTLPNIVLPGLDSLATGGEPELTAFLLGRRCGLLTNPTGASIDGEPALEVLREMGIGPVSLFSPEHGPKADQEGDIESASDGALPVHSLYGATRRPTTEMLAGIDVLICDLQDVGARFYTYASTIAHCLEQAAKHNVAVVVLDRPNPLGGVRIEGPLVDEACRSFIGYLDVPVRHGMTMGELCGLFVAEHGLTVDLRVAKMQDWGRDMTWPETGLEWRRPSPNLPDYASAAWYPGLCLLEFSGVSVGRGTEAPFQILAAPWLRPEVLISALPEWTEFEDISAEVVEVTPGHAVFAGEVCQGVRFRSRGEVPISPTVFGLGVMGALRATHAEFTDELLEKAGILVGSKAVLEAIGRNDLEGAKAAFGSGEFGKRRRRYLLY